jgi:putative transposase
MIYEFISNNNDIHTVEKMCKCMRLSKNSYYHWFRNKDTQLVASSTLLLKDRIKAIFEQNRQIYGSCRVQKMLEREGIIYSRSYVGVLMKKMGLKSVLRRKFTITTDSKHSFPIAGNVLDRSFERLEIGKKWVSDITYIRVNDGWSYLTTII